MNRYHLNGDTRYFPHSRILSPTSLLAQIPTSAPRVATVLTPSPEITWACLESRVSKIFPRVLFCVGFLCFFACGVWSMESIHTGLCLGRLLLHVRSSLHGRAVIPIDVPSQLIDTAYRAPDRVGLVRFRQGFYVGSRSQDGKLQHHTAPKKLRGNSPTKQPVWFTIPSIKCSVGFLWGASTELHSFSLLIRGPSRRETGLPSNLFGHMHVKRTIYHDIGHFEKIAFPPRVPSHK